MDCNDFLDRHSDFHDDDLGELPDRAEFERHLSSCPACARYHRVVAQGALLLRELPGPAFREDFRDRLQHRLYLSEVEGRAIPRPFPPPWPHP
jgi:anti-sigma factor RsiW